MKVPSNNLKKNYLSAKSKIDNAIKRVINNSSFILGEEVENFEKKFSNYLNIKYCVGVSSGTSALFLSLLASGIGKGDEVITSPFTWISSVEAISNTGAKPVLVDINEESYNIDPKKIESKINKNTKAIIPVHIYGNPAEMSKILLIAKKYKLKVIEDAAQAHGSKIKKKYCGTFGDFGCFSFFPSKNLGSFGDAGCVVSNNRTLIEKIKKLRNHGKFSKNNFDVLGFNERLSGMQAAILTEKLKYLDKWVNKRIKISKLYDKLLNSNIKKPKTRLNDIHSFHNYAIRVEKRNMIFNNLKKNNIDVRINYSIPIHKTKLYRKFFSNNQFPICDKVSKSILSLPIYPEMSEKEIIYVCEKLNKLTNIK